MKNQPPTKGFNFSEITSCASYIEPDASSIKSSLRAKSGYGRFETCGLETP